MTAVTIQANKIVLNEIKDNYALLEPSYRTETNFSANPIFILNEQEHRLIYMHLHAHCRIIYSITMIWRQPKCPSASEWIRKGISLYHAILLSHKKE